MKANIKKKFDEMELIRKELFQLIKNQNDERLNRKPDSNSWSVIQIIHHLMDAESGTLGYIKKKTLAPEKLEKAGLKEGINSFLLNFYLQVPFKWKAPKMVSNVPESDSLANVTQRYEKIRLKWGEFINEMPEEWLDKKIFRHPISGRMTLMGTLSFMDLHAKRHLNQIRQILDS